jgi:glycosyltransferase involved in cell wall biosynthesis
MTKKKVAFVVPWYGDKIPGGAENLCKDTVEHLAKSGFEVLVLTTCSREFLSDWKDHYEEGEYIVNGIKVRRFRVRPRDTSRFDSINGKLMNGQKITPSEEKDFINNIINSDNMCEFIRENKDYAYVFIPYMFGTTYFGAKIRPSESYIIPCLHDESYSHLGIYKCMFEDVKGLIFNSKPEMELAKRMFNLKKDVVYMGVGVEDNIESNAKRFKEKYGIKDDFILYVGRKDPTKNTPLLVEYFCRYKKGSNGPLTLVMIGGGKIHVPRGNNAEIIDLGFLPEQDKRDAYSAAMFLCQPSVNESFSIVMMESWICGTPVLVNGKCEVTREHCIQSNGGLYFDDYHEFEECVNFLLSNPEASRKMGINGGGYVRENFSWAIIMDKYRKLLT